MTYKSKKWQYILPAAVMHSFGTLHHCCCLQSTWLPRPYTLPLILCGNSCCMIYMEAEGLRWHFSLRSLTDPLFPFHSEILHHCLFFSSPSLPWTFSSFLFSITPTVAHRRAWQIGSPGAHSVYSAAAEASASVSDLFWPCCRLGGTKSCSHL